jgi:hypothetical protein
MERHIYLKQNGHVAEYSIVYNRFDESDIKEYCKKYSPDVTMWLLEKINCRVHTPTIKDAVDRFIDAEVLGSVAKSRHKVKHDKPRYVTILTLLDSHQMPVAGGCSVCSAVDSPDRTYGYSRAFERLRGKLEGLGFSIVPRAEGMRVLGIS